MSPLACSPAVTARRGFTLLELLLAIMLTAVAVAIAGSALRTATTAGERVDAHRATQEHDARLRSTLTDMLGISPRRPSRSICRCTTQRARQR
jgi:prepilin-type N-terminal cleavage/methylation domain-containing protein